MAKCKPKTEWHYEITVWNIIDGDIVKKCWDADQKEHDYVRECYGDEPFYDIVIDREWEEDVDG